MASRVSSRSPASAPRVVATRTSRSTDSRAVQDLHMPTSAVRARPASRRSVGFRTVVSMWLELARALFPLAAEGNPEGQRDQADVQPEALAADVHAVVPELVPPRDVARREDLRDAGESGTHADARLVPGYFLERLEAAADRFDLARPQRARANEAHVADEDVPELRQLVHRGRAHEPAHPGDARVVLGC